MKTLTRLALAAAILTTAAVAQAEWVSGYQRSNGTYVQPYYRTPANGTPYDNLSYRGYPSQQPGYVSPRSYGGHSGWSRPTTLPSAGSFKLNTMPRAFTGDCAPKSLNRRSSSFGF